MPFMDKRLEVAIAAAKAGGEVARRYFRSRLTVDYKRDRSPVTEADRECERRIVEVLRASFPDYGVVGEEFGEQKGVGGSARWIIDPIDGTKNFIRCIPYFATLIGLEEDGEVTTGVIYAPAVDDLIYAQKGAGAFDGNGRLHVSPVASMRESMLVFGGLDIFRQVGRWDGFERLVRACGRQRGFGDYFGHTFVARGQAEAIKIVIEEAGGRLTDFKGDATIYGGDAIASNGLVHDDILRLLDNSAKQPTIS
jgi:histidinol-phosphatase